MPMRLRCSNSGSWFRVAAVIVTLGLSGCGEDGFVPAPPPELRGAGSVSSPGAATTSGKTNSDLIGSVATGVKSVELILNGARDINEIETEKAAARLQAGTDKARLRITVVGEERAEQGPQPAIFKDQATLVREAVARHPQALIVDPADLADPELAKAIQEAQAAKVPVIVLGRPLAGGVGKPGTSATAPTILVMPEPFADSAKQLVAATIRNIKNAKLDPQGGAILLINTVGDPFIPDRVAALRDALKAAGIKAIDEIRFKEDTGAAQRLLTERLKADPKPTMVLTVDFLSSTACNEVVGTIVQERPFIQAGYTNDENQLRLARFGEFAALGHYVPNRLVRKAVSTAVAVALKQEVRSPVVIPVVIHESPPNSGVARFQTRQKASIKAKANTPG